MLNTYIYQLLSWNRKNKLTASIHVVENCKVIDAQQAKLINNYRNTRIV